MTKAKTLDGERTRVDQLNTGASPTAQTGFRGWIQRCLKNLNLIMAGMYTGLNCYGTPKTHHDYEAGEGAGEGNGATKPDQRII